MGKTSDAELKRWALANGRKVTLSDGTVFNSSGKKVSVAQQQPQPKPASEPAAPPSPAAPTSPSPSVDDETRRKIERLSASVEALMATVEAQRREIQGLSERLQRQQSEQKTVETVPPTVPPPQVPPSAQAWKFSVVRDSDGYINDIVASPKAEENKNDIGARALRLSGLKS